MRWKVFGIAAFMLAVSAVTMLAQSNPPEPSEFSSDVERRAWISDTLMPWMEGFRRHYHNVPRSDGEFLRWLVVATNRKRALEIGTSPVMNPITDISAASKRIYRVISKGKEVS